MNLLQTDNISVELADRPVLTGIDFKIEPGEIVTVVGPNGSGKSTLLRALIGAVPSSRGRITRKKNLRIGYVPQTLDIDATLPMPVRRFLSLPDWRGRGEIATALEQVGMSGLEDRALSELSGGQFQRVLLARALLCRPEVLLLDEPTQGLDQPGAAAFYRLIESVRQTYGCAVLMVSHDLHVVMSSSDRVICLNGHVCCEGTPRVVTSTQAYRDLFGLGTQGALALYPHVHDHVHDEETGACITAPAETTAP
ncbi:metal ABC transporter ATP-binding protein [Rhodobacteraceae bacterium NNCM2]|nr:metal ABC transporter ATP-binding protein [Coraliihabitans acroporae]